MTKAAAETLFISPHTVSRHIRNLCRKYRAKNSIHLQVLSGKVEGVTFSHASLSRRENEIMQLVMRGADSMDIASQMAISYATVRKHRENILLKLEVNSMRQAVAGFLAPGMHCRRETAGG